MSANNVFGVNLRNYLDGWAKYTIDKWQDELTAKNIGVTFTLKRSFEKQVSTTTDNAAKVALKFKMYGRFLDMGVGSGLKANERASNNANRAGRRIGARVNVNGRRPKKWINKIAAGQTYKLSELLNDRATQALISNFNNTNNVIVNING